jgi:hypothetical protein
MTRRTEYYKILGVKDNEIVLLEEINDCKCCGEKSGQVHVITMRPLTQEQIDYSWSEDNMEEYWKMAVESGHTREGLDDFIETMKCEYNEELPYFDDDSHRYDTEQALEELKPSDREQIHEILRQSCEEVGDTYVNIEWSSAQHIDNKLNKDDEDNFHIDSFQFVTPLFKKVFPVFEKFSKGEIDYDTCIDLVNKEIK